MLKMRMTPPSGRLPALDMRARMRALEEHPYEYEGAERSRWTTWTWVANVLGGVCLLAGGSLLITFITEST
jgi:hypothetical protein